MKVMTILGTRPEIIRLSQVIPKLDKLCTHVIVHTGQNYDFGLNDIFFSQLGLRDPDYFLAARGTFGEQIARIMIEMEKVLLAERPDRFLVLGDTNSSLGAIMAKRLGIPVYHMEAGNRCYDDRVPEEVNRRIIDHSSDILMPYTERSRQNLLREGIPGEKIYVTGNPIGEVIQCYDSEIRSSSVLHEHGLTPGGYFLVTMHRQENVDDDVRLVGLTTGLDRIQKEWNMPIIVSTHPRTRKKMDESHCGSVSPHVRYLEPFGFMDFIQLERHAYCVLSDSGTVQEECCILGVPNITIRDVTERPETLECGSNILAGADPEFMVQAVKIALAGSTQWLPPAEYIRPCVSDIVAKIITGYLH
jgi:UDP-N-acetylglucosamine 2-epimerase (non-hydrolysing)